MVGMQGNWTSGGPSIRLPAAVDLSKPETIRSAARARPFALAVRSRRGPVTGLILLALVVCLLVSDIPSSAALFGAPPLGPSGRVAAPTASSGVGAAGIPDHSLTEPERPSTAPSTAVDLAALCLLGADPYCQSPSRPAAPASAASAPSAGGAPSSWTDITPPAGSPNPTDRYLASMVEYPSGHDLVLFGGLGYPSGSLVLTYFQDTWSFAGRTWTPLIQNTSCTNTTCPSPRAGATLAYYPTDNALVLFGGFLYNTTGYHAFGDTWLFENDSWANITSTAGTAPSPRFDAVMTYDPSDNYVLLFGGSTATGHSLGDTWKFSGGAWTNITANVGGINGYQTNKAPEPRAGAAISSSPSGYVLLFGGLDDNTYIENFCNNGSYTSPGLSSIAWWFFQGKWSPIAGWGDDSLNVDCAPQSPAVAAPSSPGPSTAYPQMSPPCGRTDAGLGWSPRNNRFVLYGGVGPALEGLHGACNGPPTWLNDTWLYGDPVGGGFVWYNVSDAGDPPARTEMGYASDFTDGYFDIFGGYGEGVVSDQTWRFYAIVHAQLSGPVDINTGSGMQFPIPFLVTAFGGSGNLTYSFLLHGLRNSNTLSGTGCSEISGGKPPPIAYDGTASILCTPTQGSFNVYRLTLDVVDAENSSDRATANWTFTVTPPEAMDIDSEYLSIFYTNVQLENTFSIFATVAHGPARTISATIGGNPLSFTQRSGAPDWWDAKVQMASVSPGEMILATAQFGNWTENATFAVDMVTCPAWLLTLFHFSGATQSIVPTGPGPYNKTFTINEAYSWNLGQALGFNLPVPLVGGDYSLIPSINVVLSATSDGALNLTGTFALNPPSINFGAFTLSLTANLYLDGTFQIGSAGSSGGSTIVWDSATAAVNVAGDFSGSVPLYGFSILGVTIGFVLDVDVNPSISLSMMLAPTTETSQEIISGIGIMIEQFLGTFTLPLSVSVNFGVGVASVGIGGTLSVALQFHSNPSLSIFAGWVNGSVFVQASAMFWSDSWTLVSGTVYSWNDPPGAVPAAGPHPEEVGYNNGTGTTWTLDSRYYSSGGYDADVWKALGSTGTAISDIYPHTEVASANANNAAYLFYTDDNTSEPVQNGLGISVARLDASTNQLTSVPGPREAGFDLANPKATTLPDGNIYVVWDALPGSEASLSSPVSLSSLDLQGALFDPATDTWGPIHTFTSWDLAQSYQVDATGNSGQVAVLLSNAFLIGDTTPERLVAFNLTTGAELSNTSATGLSELLSYRGSPGEAVVQDLEGNDSLVDLSTGSSVSVPYTPPAHSGLLSEAFAQGSPSTLVLLYRANASSELVLYDSASHTTLGALSIGGNTSQAQAVSDGSSYYAFVRTGTGIEGWTETGGVFSNLTNPTVPGIGSFGVTSVGSSLLLYSLDSNGNDSQPIRSLAFDEVGAAVPLPPPAPSTSSTSTSTSLPGADYVAILVVVAVVVVLLLAVIAMRGHRPPDAAGTTNQPSPAAPPPWAETPEARGSPAPPPPPSPPAPPPPTG